MLLQLIIERQLQKIKVADLKFDKTNPNHLTAEQMNGLRKSMERFGFLTPIIVDKQTNMIADGEHRALVHWCIGGGIQEISCYFVEFADDSERRLLRQTMNKLRGTHDKTLDADELASLFEHSKLDHLSELIAQNREDLERRSWSFRPSDKR